MSDVLLKHHIDAYTAELFRRYVGQPFRFHFPEGAAAVCGPELDLTLIEVTEDERVSKSAARRAGKSGKAMRTPFSIIFRASRENPLSSGMLRMEHEDFEEFPVFLSRVHVLPGDSDEDDKPHYEAVFG